jgi:hypothetical protein
MLADTGKLVAHRNQRGRYIAIAPDKPASIRNRTMSLSGLLKKPSWTTCHTSSSCPSKHQTISTLTPTQQRLPLRKNLVTNLLGDLLLQPTPTQIKLLPIPTLQKPIRPIGIPTIRRRSRCSTQLTHQRVFNRRRPIPTEIVVLDTELQYACDIAGTTRCHRLPGQRAAHATQATESIGRRPIGASTALQQITKLRMSSRKGQQYRNRDACNGAAIHADFHTRTPSVAKTSL